MVTMLMVNWDDNGDNDDDDDDDDDDADNSICI